jgi:hypothetical protein
MIPTELTGWTIEVVETLLARKSFESDLFDYKAQIPHSKDRDGKLRLRKECCAFANTEGGFLIFGVHDDRSLAPAARLVGIPVADDFAAYFGEYPAQCAPTIDWTIGSLALRDKPDMFLHIVHIPRSWRGPHVVADDQKTDLWYFSKRTNKGIEAMSYEEVRMAFTGQYERRRKLRLLRQELEQIGSQSSIFILPDEPKTLFTPVASELPLGLIEAIINDSFLILEERGGLLNDLNELRFLARQINHGTAQFLQDMTRFGPGIDPVAQRREHNAIMRERISTIQRTVARCLEGLDQIR